MQHIHSRCVPYREFSNPHLLSVTVQTNRTPKQILYETFVCFPGRQRVLTVLSTKSNCGYKQHVHENTLTSKVPHTKRTSTITSCRNREVPSKHLHAEVLTKETPQALRHATISLCSKPKTCWPLQNLCTVTTTRCFW
jgi:hypothetical protein